MLRQPKPRRAVACQEIARGIAFKFRQPPYTSIRWRGAVFTAAVSMPKAAVNEDDGLVFRENDVGASGEFFSVQTKTVAEPMQQRANAFLGRGVLAPNAAHVPGTSLFCEPVF